MGKKGFFYHSNKNSKLYRNNPNKTCKPILKKYETLTKIIEHVFLECLPGTI